MILSVLPSIRPFVHSGCESHPFDPLTVSEFHETWSVYVYRWKKRPGIGRELKFSLFTKIGAKTPQKLVIFLNFWMWSVRSQRWAQVIDTRDNARLFGKWKFSLFTKIGAKTRAAILLPSPPHLLPGGDFGRMGADLGRRLEIIIITLPMKDFDNIVYFLFFQLNMIMYWHIRILSWSNWPYFEICYYHRKRW